MTQVHDKTKNLSFKRLVKIGCLFLFIFLLVGVYNLRQLAKKDHTDKPSYTSLLQIYESIETGDSLEDIQPCLKEINGLTFVEIHEKQSYATPWSPKKNQPIHADTLEMIIIDTPLELFANNRILGIQFNNQKVTAVMMRIADTSKVHPKNEPPDKVATNTTINPRWVNNSP